MMTKTAPHHRRPGMAIAFTLGVFLALLTGCSSGQTPMEALIEQITPQTPGQVAREAFNVYDADVRRNSVNSLAAARFGGEEPYLRLYRLLIDDPDPTVRAACCKALGLHGQVEDVALIIPYTEDESTAVRWEAVKALQKIHSPSAIDPLIERVTQDQDNDVRQAAAIALGQYPSIAVFNVLVGALDDRSYTVVGAAHQSLVTLTGYDFGVDGSNWLIFARKDSQKIFEKRTQYYWQPYQPPRGFWDRIQFWKKPPEPIPPQIPRGMAAVAGDAA